MLDRIPGGAAERHRGHDDGTGDALRSPPVRPWPARTARRLRLPVGFDPLASSLPSGTDHVATILPVAPSGAGTKAGPRRSPAMGRRTIRVAAALLLLGAAPVIQSETTEDALRVLLAASSLPIPPASSCYGLVRGVARPTLGDFLATPLAGLNQGTNRVTGGCDRDRCRVLITHSAGEEDLFSYEYRFRTARGRLVPASLTCISTP